jgi:biotin synthase-like enzyme
MLNVFSSARVLRSYTMEQLVGLGIGWVWMGIEGKNSRYRKLEDVDTHQLVKRLQSHGIRVLGSSIIGLEHHTPENIDQVIAHAVSHDTDFHQFMLYTPVPGTPLYDVHRQNDTLLSEDV